MPLFVRAQIFYDITNLRNQNPDLVWAYDRIKIEAAWDLVKSKMSNFAFVNIGVIDTGIDSTHSEFRPNVTIDSDLPTDVSFSFIGALFNLPNGHGTQVAGIVGADNKSTLIALPVDSPEVNGIVSGVTGNYKITARFVGPGDTPTAGITLFNIQNAYNSGARIINMSFGWAKCLLDPKIKGCLDDDRFDKFSASFSDLFKAFDDALFIAAAGNDGINVVNFVPANINLSNVVTTAGTDRNDQRANFGLGKDFRIHLSNFGSRIDIAAPGVDVYTPAINGGYDKNFSGTSASAPMVTGVAAILKSIKPELTPAEIKEILIKSADPIFTSDPDEQSKLLGQGCSSESHRGCRLNAHRAVSWLFPPTPVVLEKPQIILEKPQTYFFEFENNCDSSTDLQPEVKACNAGFSTSTVFAGSFSAKWNDTQSTSIDFGNFNVNNPEEIRFQDMSTRFRMFLTDDLPTNQFGSSVADDVRFLNIWKSGSITTQMAVKVRKVGNAAELLLAVQNVTNPTENLLGTTFSVPLNQWLDVALFHRFNDELVELYIDGVLKDTLVADYTDDQRGAAANRLRHLFARSREVGGTQASHTIFIDNLEWTQGLSGR